MAQIDSSIYFKQQQADVLGSVQKGLSVRDMLDKKAKEKKADEKEQDFKKAYNAGIVKNPDGSVSHDGSKTASELAGRGYGKEAVEAQNQFKQQTAMDQKANLEKQMQEINVTGQLLGGIQDQASWEQGLMKAQQMGMDVSRLPRAYDPGMVRNLQMRTLSAKEQIENQFKQQQFSAGQKNEDRNYALNLQKAEVEKQKAKADLNKKSGTLEGLKALDKDYAKDYNDFTSNGAENARGSIAKLKEIRAELANEGDGLFAAGGGRSEIIPDAFRSKTSVRWRDQAQSAANATLKSIFGGQLSDGERKSAAAEFYNDKLSNADNVKILDSKIQAMEQGLTNQLSKAEYFSKYGTLNGFEDSTALRGTTAPNQKEINQSPMSKTQKKQVFKTDEIDWAE